MPLHLEYGPIDPAANAPALARIMSHAFGFPPEDFAPYLEKTGAEHFRCLREGGTPVACLVVIPMGQFFGGTSVPMTGIAAVGVAPERRGRGIAGALMRETLREVREKGVPLSGLYPATQPLYRRAGYEQAGHRFEFRIPITRLAEEDPLARGATGRGHSADRKRTAPSGREDAATSPTQSGGGGALSVRPFVVEDMEAVRRCYSAVARVHDGHLDRGSYVWSRVVHPRQGPAAGFLFEGDGGPEGYLFLRQERVTAGLGAVGRHDVHITDWCAATERAGRALLRFAAEFGSMGEEVVCHGGPGLPLLMLMKEQRYAVRLRDYWMVRIVDVPGALRGRGWPAAARGELHLDVADDLFPENAGRWTLRVEGGSAQVERGGRGAVRADIRGLAAWYSGYLGLPTLRRLGRVHGDDETLRAAEGLIAAGTPWMPDMF